MPRGSGFEFHEKVVGGAVPRNYIGAVEEGVVDGLVRGPLGFPVIDVHVTLTDGSYHSVNSSDLAFRTESRVGLTEALPQCAPVLLEPLHTVEIVCPTDATAKINAILSARRGQILGFDTREGWSGGSGMRPRHHAGGRDRRPDRGIALRHRRRRQLYPAVRPHGRSFRPRRPTRSSPRTATRRSRFFRPLLLPFPPPAGTAVFIGGGLSACRMMYFTSLSVYELSLILLHIWAGGVITSFQMRAARALLGIDQKTLAELAGVSLPTIQRMEASAGNVRGVVKSLTRVVEALDRAGVALIGEGARSDEGGRGVRLKEPGPPRRI